MLKNLSIILFGTAHFLSYYPPKKLHTYYFQNHAGTFASSLVSSIEKALFHIVYPNRDQSQGVRISESPEIILSLSGGVKLGKFIDIFSYWDAYHQISQFYRRLALYIQ